MPMTQNSPKLIAAPVPLAPPASGVRRVNAQEWMGRGTILEIEHQGQVYRLQITRQGKLILTK
jgi:hemin uptake protein HemP